MNKNCKKCQSEFEAPSDPILSRFTPFCPSCASSLREASEKAEKARLMDFDEMQWKSICPPAYRDTLIEKLPNQSKAQEVLAWNYNSRGLLLHGKTRRGKSRCAWLLARKAFNAGKSIRILDSMSGFQYGAAFSTNGRAAEEWVLDRCKCGLLLMDDVFKVKLTDSFESAVFAIVDYRLSHCLPILATLNDTGDTLARRMTGDRGDAFVARLKEMCDAIRF